MGFVMENMEVAPYHHHQIIVMRGAQSKQATNPNGNIPTSTSTPAAPAVSAINYRPAACTRLLSDTRYADNAPHPFLQGCR